MFKFKKNRITLSVFVTSTVGILGVVFTLSIIYLNRSFSESIETILDKETINYTSLASSLIVDKVQDYLLITGALSANPSVIRTVNALSATSDVVRIFDDIKASFEMEEAYLMLSSGKLLFRSAQDSSLLLRSEFKETVAEAYRTETPQILAVDSELYRTRIVYIMVPIAGAQHQAIVILGKVFNDEFFAELPHEKSNGLFLVNDQGRVVASSGIPKEQLSILIQGYVNEEVLNSPSVALSKLYQTDLFSGEIALSKLDIGGDVESITGHDVESGHEQLGLFGFYVDGNELFSTRQLLYTLNLYIVIIILMFFIFSVYILKKYVIEPINLIDSALVELSGGDFEIKMKEQGLREIAAIAAGFNIAVEQLKKLNDAKTGFISIASHQLRTPLTAMRWFSEMLIAGDAGKINDQQKTFVERIYNGTDRMIALVNLLLQIARVEAGRVRIQPELVDIKITTEEIVQTIKKLIDDKGQKVLVTMEPEPFPKVALDKEVIWQVIQNLVTNANRYSPKNGTVYISVIKKDRFIEYSVKDEGIGIPESQKLRIFEKFFRAENALKAVPEGSGLGLSLVKLLVEGWGGTVWFESEAGIGTTFYFTIPLEGMRAKEGEVGLKV